jgi:hypothetical protein
LTFHNGNRALTNDPPGDLRYVVLATIKNETGQPVNNCILQLVRVGQINTEYYTLLCAPFDLLIDQTLLQIFTEYVRPTTGQAPHLVFPTFWHKDAAGKWEREPGGLIGYEGDEVVLQLLSESARSVRLHLQPKITEDGHWDFAIISDG